MKKTNDLTLDFSRALAEFQRKLIPHAVFRQIVEDCEAKIMESGIMPDPDSMLITGESRVGKTAIAKHVVSKHDRYYEKHPDGNRLIVPAFYCQMPAKTKVKDLAAVLLQQLGVLAPIASADPLSSLIKALVRCQTKIIFLDEIHHVFRVRGEVSTRELRDWIKNMLSATQIPVVFLGLPECEVFVRAEDQLDARIPKTYLIQPFGIPQDDKHPLCKTIASLQKEFQSHLGMTLLQGENITDLSQRFCIATGGRIGRIRIMMRDAARVAFVHGMSDVNYETLTRGYASAPPSTSLATNFNPFSISRTDLDERLANKDLKDDAKPKRRRKTA